MNYRDTLNLPKTSFSMKAGLAQKEPIMLKDWNEKKIYESIRKKTKSKKKFFLHDGPPYANGHIHIGHALNKILKDIIVKFKTMQGFDALYIPGWDCHGLPIEHQLLKEMKMHQSQIEILDFRKKAHDYAMKYVSIQKEEFQRLGVFGQWEEPYLTLDPNYEFWILKSLAILNDKGYIYRGLKPVHWCASCETALAEAEVEYDQYRSPSIYVKFLIDDLADHQELLGKKVFLLVWTTTPWTLLGNVAVSVHPQYVYVFVKVEDEIFVLEKTLMKRVFEKKGIKDFQVIKECLGQNLQKITYQHPFGLRHHCPIVAADYVTKEDGTGLVHTAPGHGQEDYETGLTFGLDVVVPVNQKGIFTSEGGEFKDLHVFKANPKIIESLDSKGFLFFQEDFGHSYPHCWRCKKPTLFRATKQWFVNVEANLLRSHLLKIIQSDVQWIPEAGQERIEGMIKNRPDWCLSRQRYWGVPIPALICHGCHNEQRLLTEAVEYFASIVKEEGTDAWFAKDLKDLIPQGLQCPDCGQHNFEKAYDILDVWFDSGVSHQAVFKGMLGDVPPADLYLEGSDQHRGWFQSSLIPSSAIDHQAPFKAVLTHGFVVDGQGRKMSKSFGNVVSPQDIIKNYGADFLRLWVASSNYREDIRISKEIMDRLVDAYRKIRNTIRFMLSNLFDFDPENVVAFSDLNDLDQWALSRLAHYNKVVQEKYDQYDFSEVYKQIYSFCNEEMSGIYLDILKDRLYTFASSSLDRRSAQTALYHILNHFVRLLAPILAFTAQEIWQAMPKAQELKNISNVHLLELLDSPQEWLQADIVKRLEPLLALRPQVLKALEEKRQQGIIGSSLEAKVVIEVIDELQFQGLKYFSTIFLQNVFIVSQAQVRKVKVVDKHHLDNNVHANIIIEKADGQKCPRCWNYYEDLGAHRAYPDICLRCAEAISFKRDSF